MAEACAPPRVGGARRSKSSSCLQRAGYLFTELGEKLLADSKCGKGMCGPCIGKRGILSGLGHVSELRTRPRHAGPPPPGLEARSRA